jgi:O-antigen/teichoic acid export membrane protein
LHSTADSLFYAFVTVRIHGLLSNGSLADIALEPPVGTATPASSRSRSLIPHFLATQGAIQALNVACGLLILRFLSVPDFAVYVVLTGLQTVASVCSDMGLSQAMNTFAARAHGDKRVLGKLFNAANAIRRWLLALALVITAAFAFAMLRHTSESRIVGIAGFLMVFATARSQQFVSLRTVILNAHHDSAALFRSGMSAAIARVVLVLAFLPHFPHVLVAFMTNLAASVASAVVIRRLSNRYIENAPAENTEQRRQLLTFIYPLFPGALYFLVQGQVATILLSIDGQVNHVAEVGALSRLSQLLAFFALLNPFWVQPTFARIKARLEFRRRATQLMTLLTLGSMILVLSSLLWPTPWLLVLGHQYAGLTRELPLAVFAGMVGIVGATLFTLVMAVGDMRRQFFHIPLGIAAQCAVLFVYGVNSTHDAILLTAAPQVTYALLQASLLFLRLFRSGSEGVNDGHR